MNYSLHYYYKTLSQLMLCFSLLIMMFFLYVLKMNLELIIIWNFFPHTIFNFEFSLFFDYFSMIFFFSVFFISLSVIFYSISYMKKELFFNRFMMLKFVFIFCMFLMIFSSNFILIIVGWDGLGISSFLLVIYYHNNNSINSGLITMFINRLGDVGLIFSMIFFLMISDWNFFIFNKSNLDLNETVVFMIFLTCITKSAQLPFSSWLPAAMAAPTPISSLVHSSTLVTAGVYLMFRFSEFFTYSYFFFFISMTTCFMANLAATFELDGKKIIALSTLSHLSIMFNMMNMGFSKLMFSHLIFHAYFKALLFMAMGLVIHLSMNYQDSRKINNLKLMNVLNSLTIFIAISSLCGTPFLTGFFSKDFFLEIVLLQKSSMMIISMILISSLMSFIYSYRLMNMILSFNNNFKFYWTYYNNLNYFKSYCGLIILSIFMGNFLMNFLMMKIHLIFLEINMKITITLSIFLMLMFTINLDWKLSFPNILSIFLSELFFFNYFSKKMMLKKKWSKASNFFFFESKLMEMNWIKMHNLFTFYPSPYFSSYTMFPNFKSMIFLGLLLYYIYL